MYTDRDFAQLQRYLYGLDSLQPSALKVMFLAADSTGCAWYRGRQPANRINKNFPAKVNQIVSGFMIGPDADPGPDDPAWDVVVHQRQNDFNNLGWVERMRKSVNPVMVYEADDDFLHVDRRSQSALYYTKERIMNSLRYMSKMDAMTVSTEPLKQLYAPYNPNITVIPNAIEFEIIDQLPAKTPHDDIIIGWFGSATHLVDLEVVFPVIADLLKKYKNVRFKFGGWPTCPLLKDLPQDQLIVLPFVNDMMEYYKSLRDVDILITPLADIPFNTCKSNLKFLEGGSQGIAVVASDVTAYNTTVRDGVNGILVKARGATYKRWFKTLEDLIHDKPTRDKLGKTAATFIRQNFNQGKIAQQWVDFYAKVLFDFRNKK